MAKILKENNNNSKMADLFSSSIFAYYCRSKHQKAQIHDLSHDCEQVFLTNMTLLEKMKISSNLVFYNLINFSEHENFEKVDNLDKIIILYKFKNLGKPRSKNYTTQNLKMINY